MPRGAAVVAAGVESRHQTAVPIVARTARIASGSAGLKARRAERRWLRPRGPRSASRPRLRARRRHRLRIEIDRPAVSPGTAQRCGGAHPTHRPPSASLEARRGAWRATYRWRSRRETHAGPPAFHRASNRTRKCPRGDRPRCREPAPALYTQECRIRFRPASRRPLFPSRRVRHRRVRVVPPSRDRSREF